MAVRRLHPEQPAHFAFTAENDGLGAGADREISGGKAGCSYYSIVVAGAGTGGRWLPEPAIRYVTDMLGMAHIRGLEVATFYTMFQLAPVGSKAHVQVCGTTPCMLRGSNDR